MTRRSIKAGEGYVEIGIRNRIAAGAAGVQRDLDKLGRRVNALGGIVGGIGLAMGAPIAFAAKTLAGFDDAMRSVGAISQASAKDLGVLTTTAKELGRTTGFTAVEVASLMIELARAGFDPSQIDAMTGLRPSCPNCLDHGPYRPGQSIGNVLDQIKTGDAPLNRD